MLKGMRLCTAAILLVGPLAAHAALIGPSYPAPGGNTFSAGTYSGFDTSAFSSLYWGSSSAAGPSAGLDGTAEPLTFTGVNGNIESFTGTTLWLDHNNGQTISVPIELLITVTGLGADPWVSFSNVNGSDPSGVGDVVNDSSGLSFTVTKEFLADVGSGFQDISTIDVPTGDAVKNFTGAFYSTAPVPLPPSFWLMACGLIGVGFLGRRRNTSA